MCVHCWVLLSVPLDQWCCLGFPGLATAVAKHSKWLFLWIASLASISFGTLEFRPFVESKWLAVNQVVHAVWFWLWFRHLPRSCSGRYRWYSSRNSLFVSCRRWPWVITWALDVSAWLVHGWLILLHSPGPKHKVFIENLALILLLHSGRWCLLRPYLVRSFEKCMASPCSWPLLF